MHEETGTRGVWQGGEVWPLLWRFGDGTDHDLPLGKEVLASAQEVLGEGTIRHLLVDAGFLNREWLSELAASMTVTIRIRKDMDLFSDLLGLARMEPEAWEEVALPQRPKGKEKPRRQLLPEREFAVYAGRYDALLRASELMAILFDHFDAYRENKENIRAALQVTEGTRLDR